MTINNKITITTNDVIIIHFISFILDIHKNERDLDTCHAVYLVGITGIFTIAK